MDASKEKFESLWNNFVSLVKSKLMQASRGRSLTQPLANLILSEAAHTWVSEYDLNGKWLYKYAEENEKKAALIKEILLTDMQFSEIKQKGTLPDYCNYIIPAIGAAAGYAIGEYFKFNNIWHIVSTVAPAVLLVPAVKTYRNNQQSANKANSINLYIEQLTKYRDSIISILS